jgi:predicted LPLAT superfamily acyltransferase
MARLSLRLGRPAGRVILYGIGAYYFLFAPRAARHARVFLRRALGREPRARDRFRLLMSFATSIQDRLYLLAGRYELFDISLSGEPLLCELADSGRGALLLGSHLGSFEVLRAIGERRPGQAIAMAMYEANARNLNDTLEALTPRDRNEIIVLGRLEAMLKIRERIEQGTLVGMLADRTLGDEESLPVSFLGATARLPLGPMRAAAMFRCRTVFMAGLYRGGNRYHVVAEPLADFTDTPPAQRRAAIEAAITRFAALLERHCRADPYNWFNFYDFWGEQPDAQPRSRIGDGTDAARV